MYNVLIVDDESAHRKGIIQLLNRIKPHYRLLEARDGSSAGQMLAAADIDIVLTDIRMPNMDGLELLQEINKANREAKVIMITGHAQFEYAKRALSDGAFDFLMKPIDIKELNAALDKAENSILTKNAQQLTQGLGIDMLLGKLVKGKLDEQERRQLAGMVPDSLPGFLFVIKIPPAAAQILGPDCFAATRSTIRKAMKPIGPCLQFQLLDGEVSLVGMVFLDRGQGTVQGAAREAINRIVRELPSIFKMGVSECFDRLSASSAQAYAQARDALLMTFYSHAICGEFKEQNRNDQNRNDIHLPKLFNDHEAFLANAIKYESRERVAETVSGLFGKLGAHDTTNPNRMKELMLLTALRLTDGLQSKIAARDSHPEIAGFNARITEAPSLQALQAAVEGLCLMLYDISHSNDSSEEAITLALNYIDEHFFEEVSLSQLAERYYFTSSYFSLYFKKKTGQNFNQYLTALRLERACKYLLETADKVGDISLKVGYTDSAYFGKLFKKRIGCSPEEYRRRNYKI